jgi:nucleotidyltransferase substrate binding protein (TIGR01987 family)
MELDIRWQQRLVNYKKALAQLEKFLEKDKLNDLEIQGLIQAFEYTFELAWKTLQDLLSYKGFTGIAGPKPVAQQAFQDGYIEDGDGWIRMLESRNLASHTYNEEIASNIVKGIRQEYFDLMKSLMVRLEKE